MVLFFVECDVCFKVFVCVFFKQDFDLMYEVVIEDFIWMFEEVGVVCMFDSCDKIVVFWEECCGCFENVCFEDVVYYYVLEVFFMIFCMIGLEVVMGECFEKVGVECYVFCDGKLMIKDVYSRLLVQVLLL